MRNSARILVVVGVIMLIVLAWRFTGGPIGPRTYAFIAATAVVFIAAAVMWRRRSPPPPPPPR